MSDLFKEIVWRILGTRCVQRVDNVNDFVNQLQWQCYINKENPNTGNVDRAQTSGYVDFTYDPNGSFIPRAELTEEDMLNWIWSNGVNKAEVEAQLEQSLTATN